ncbi:unnamed protein product [Cochlearia groenlandica]
MSHPRSAFEVLMCKTKNHPKACSSSAKTKKRKVGPRCAFEALMCNALAKTKNPPKACSSSAKTKNHPQSKKRKLVGGSDNIAAKIPISESSVKPPRSRSCRVVGSLKSKIGLLKKEPYDFDPESVRCWENGESVPFMFLSLAFDLISTVKPNQKVTTRILCNLLRTVIATTPKDLVPTVYLAANEIAPAHDGFKLGIGRDPIIKAISETFNITVAQVKKLSTETRDLGLVAKQCRQSKTMHFFKPKPLTVVGVFNKFRQIAKESGEGSMKNKKDLIQTLLMAATDCEPLYLIRLLELDFSRPTVLAALGQAAVYNEEHAKPPPNTKNPLDEAAKIVQQVFSVLPVYDIIIGALLTSGMWSLPKTCTLTPGIPVLPMLAKPRTSLGSVLDQFEDTVLTFEYKYDGERAQIHYMEDGTFEIFSRNAKRNTAKYPDVALALSRLKKPSVKSFVMDCEVVAFDMEKNKFLPLQRLYDSFDEDDGYFQFATALTSSNRDEIQEFLKASIDIGIGDSVDLVPIAGFDGHGKRKEVYGAFLVACYDVDKEEFQSICKIGTGFSEAQLEKLSSSLCSKEIATPKKCYRVDKSLKPSDWFEPTQVWEVKASDLTISPLHLAAIGIVEPYKGISLRGARMVRVREDKKPEEATSSKQIAEMYLAQKVNQPRNQTKGDDD